MNDLSTIDWFAVVVGTAWLITVLWVCLAKGGQHGDE